MDALAVVAILLLVAGVAGSLLPLVPGPLLSVAGVLLYWWQADYTDPALPVVVALVGVGVAAVLVDYLGGALAAKVGGASLAASLAGAVAGVVLLVVTGPVGALLGVAATVFLVEYVRVRKTRSSARAAGIAVIGTLASAVVQVALTATMLVVFLVAVLL